MKKVFFIDSEKVVIAEMPDLASHDGSALSAEFHRLIMPLLSEGKVSGRMDLMGVRHVLSTLTGERSEPIPVSWRLSLPWWDPRNEFWWLEPFCVPSNLASRSRWVLDML